MTSASSADTVRASPPAIRARTGCETTLALTVALAFRCGELSSTTRTLRGCFKVHWCRWSQVSQVAAGMGRVRRCAGVLHLWM